MMIKSKLDKNDSRDYRGKKRKFKHVLVNNGKYSIATLEQFGR